jgi:polysaccharide biosynthesis protein PslH
VRLEDIRSVRLLFVVPYTPNLIRTRPYNFLCALARRNHRLTLATLWESEAERAALDALVSRGVKVIARPLARMQRAANALATLPMGVPLQARYCWQPTLARDILQALDDGPAIFDAIHVEHLRGAAYARNVQAHLRHQGRQTPVVWDSVDCISLLFEQAARSSRSRFSRWMARFELPRTQRYEGRLVREFACVLATSARDQAALAALAQARDGRGRSPNVRVVPNGVDQDYFSPADVVPPVAGPIILSGKMSYHANVTAALRLVSEIMPRVWAHRPATEVVIAGANPPPAIQALAEHYAPRVTVTGYVADLRPYLRSAAVAAAPVAYGTGIQNKVLEAMACGVPTVVSPPAAQALQAQPQRDLLVADTDKAFAAALLQLLGSPEQRQALGRAGRAYVARYHDWNVIAAQLEMIYAAGQPVAIQGSNDSD